MADYSQNISNTVRVFGDGPTTKWGDANGSPYTMTWGTSVWGEDNSLPVLFVKVLHGQDIATAFDYYGSSQTKYFTLGTFTVDSEPGSEILQQGSWNYVFTSNVDDAEDRNLASWSEVSNNDVTFTCQAAAGTTWSDA